MLLKLSGLHNTILLLPCILLSTSSPMVGNILPLGNGLHRRLFNNNVPVLYNFLNRQSSVVTMPNKSVGFWPETGIINIPRHKQDGNGLV